MAYQFLKSAHENESIYYAISEDRIERMAQSEAYDQFGQKISHSDAGDYLTIDTQDAADEANRLEAEEYGDVELEEVADPVWSVGDCITAYEHGSLFDEMLKHEGVSLETPAYFDGFNYWNGNNHRTIAVASFDDNGITHEIEDDEEIIARLNAAIENEEFVREGFGTRTYRHEDAIITYSQFAAAWEYCTITLENDIEDEE